jgi:hypothetical protein
MRSVLTAMAAITHTRGAQFQALRRNPAIRG